MRLRCKYEYANPYGHPKHVYTCVGRYGAVNFHVTDLGEDASTRYSAGIEVHYREPPSYMAHDAPSQDRCWLLGSPCWHDGSSLYASEHLIPQWLAFKDDPETMFRIMESEYKMRLDPHGEAEERWEQEDT